MSEVHGPVDGVDYPFIVGVHNDLSSLFAEDVVIGIVFLYYFKDRFFRGVVCFRNQVINAFLIGDGELSPENTAA